MVGQSGNRVAIVSAASFAGVVASDSIAAIYGVGLAIRAETAGSQPLPTELAGTTVTIGGRPAPLFYVSPSQINCLVPPDLEPGQRAIVVRSGDGTISLSGFLEDTRKQPIRDVTVKLRGTTYQTTTDAEGLFSFKNLPDLGRTVEIEIDPSSATQAGALPFPKLFLKKRFLTARDNFLDRIPLQQDSTLSVQVGAPPAQNANAAESAVPDQSGFARQISTGGVIFKVQSDTPAQFPDGATRGRITMTIVADNRRPIPLPPTEYISSVVQLTPFTTALERGGKLSFPNPEGLAPGTLAKLYRFVTSVPGDPNSESSFVVEEAANAQVSADGQRIETAAGAIKTTSYYFVSAPRKSTTVVGRVVESEGGTPVRGALVISRGQTALTDGDGSFVRRQVLVNEGERIAVDAGYLRPNGRVARGQISNVPVVVNGITTLPSPISLTSEDNSRLPIVLAPPSLVVSEGEDRSVLLLATHPDGGQIISLVPSGAPFATVSKISSDLSLRLAPRLGDRSPAYALRLTATDNRGQTATYEIELAVNGRPVARQQAVSTAPDQPRNFALAGEDPEGLALSYVIVANPANGKLTGALPNLTYTPNPGFIGTDQMIFKVNDALVDSADATGDLTIIEFVRKILTWRVKKDRMAPRFGLLCLVAGQLGDIADWGYMRSQRPSWFIAGTFSLNGVGMLEERTCPQCGDIFSPPTRFCNSDGSKLDVTNSLIGRVFHDKYRIEDWLGGGGMATVYRATHLKMQEEFAVKVLNPEMVGQERIADRFRNEAKAAMRINHPNAIRVTDFDITDDNLHYLVMEIVKGRLLRDLIREGRLDYRRAVKLLCQACEAIYAAHNQRIIHRDLKPDNIIIKKLGGEETVKVLDFGIARLREGDGDEGVTKPGTVIGTLAYMSPEQCRGGELGEPSDIYSLGVIGYEMMTRRTPIIPAEKWNEFVRRLQTEPLPPLREFAPEVPPAIESVIMGALEKTPGRRPPSALIMSKWLQKAIREAEGRPTDPQGDATTDVEEGGRFTSPLSQIIVGGNEETIKVRPQTPVPMSLPPQPLPVPPFLKSRVALMVGAAAILAVVLGALIYRLIFRGDPSSGTGPKTITISDQIGEMVLIPGGKFTMGDNNGAEGESPAHEVEVNEFYLDKHEVTNQQYKKFIDATGRGAPSHWTGRNFPTGEGLVPVTRVTWEDAAAYAKWANGRRLPTEAEWEYAARSGGKGYLYPWGNEWAENRANANLGRQGPSPVTSFSEDRNEFGAIGLAGNVSEWVQNLHLRYDNNQAVHPTCADCRVYRGGNYKTSIGESGATRRWSNYPTLPKNPDDQQKYERFLPRIGFRCAKSK